MSRWLTTAILATGLLAAASAVAQPPPPGPCDLSWEIDASGRLWISHAMEANCGIEYFEYEVTVEDDVLHVRESGMCPWGLAVCLCPYGTDLVLYGLAPGDYTVDWQWAEIDLAFPSPIYWVACEFPLTIPDTARDAEFSIVGWTAWGCGIQDVVSVPEGEPQAPVSTRWGDLKARYR